MTDKRNSAALEALSALLEAERTALLTGELDALAAMVDDKARLIDAMAQDSDASHDALMSLGEKVKRNQVLLDGALDGIRTVARRLATIRRVRVSLDTYDASGTRRAIDVTAQPSVEKRA